MYNIVEDLLNRKEKLENEIILLKKENKNLREYADTLDKGNGESYGLFSFDDWLEMNKND